MNLWATLAVFRFELRRTLTPIRAVFWIGLACFPPLIVALIRHNGGHVGNSMQGAFPLFVLIPEAVCLMGLLLWATPTIHAELEGKTWSYLAVRSGGKGSVLLGKYMAAVAWTAPAAWLALTLCLMIARPGVGALHLWTVFAVLTAFSCLTYGALYVLLGIIFLRRAMVVAVAYTFISEVLVAMIPAVINQLTVQYHLRCLMAKWMHWNLPPDMRLLFGMGPAWQHVLILLGATAALLTAAVLVLRQRELVKADEA